MLASAGAAERQFREQLDRTEVLSRELAYATEAHLHLRLSVIQHRTAEYNILAKEVAAKSSLVLVKNPGSPVEHYRLARSVLEESEEKLAHLKERYEELTPELTKCKASIDGFLKELERLANELPELADMPYKVKLQDFDVKTPHRVAQDRKIDIEDLLADLANLETEVLNAAEQFPAELFISHEKLTEWGLTGCSYARLLKLAWPEPKFNVEAGQAAGQRDDNQIRVNDAINDKIGSLRSETQFESQLTFEIYQAMISISQAKGLIINLKAAPSFPSQGSLEERTAALFSVAYDYGKGLLNNLFANHLLARRQERTSVKVSSLLHKLHAGEQKYWLEFCSYVSHILHLVHCMRNPSTTSERDFSSCLAAVANSASAIIKQTLELKALLAQCEDQIAIMRYRKEQMDLKLQLMQTRKETAMGLNTARLSLSPGKAGSAVASPKP